MKVRKTKFDDRIYFDSKNNLIVHVTWDCAWDRVDNWFHYDGKRVWWTKGNFEVPPHYALVDRLPEGTLR